MKAFIVTKRSLQSLNTKVELFGHRESVALGFSDLAEMEKAFPSFARKQ